MPNQILDFVLKDNGHRIDFDWKFTPGTAVCCYYSLLISCLSSFFPVSRPKPLGNWRLTCPS